MAARPTLDFAGALQRLGARGSRHATGLSAALVASCAGLADGGGGEEEERGGGVRARRKTHDVRAGQTNGIRKRAHAAGVTLEPRWNSILAAQESLKVEKHLALRQGDRDDGARS